MSSELHQKLLNYFERKYGPRALDSAFMDPAAQSVDYNHEMTRFTKSIQQRSLAFAFFEAKESRRKGDFNRAMLGVSEVVRDHVTALRNIQNLFDELSGSKPKQVVFQKFRQFEPLEVGMENAPDVFRILNEFVYPWKTENSELITQFLAMEKQVDFEQKRLAVLERFSSAAEDLSDSEKQRKQLGDCIKQHETLQFRLGTALTDMADDILKNMAAHQEHIEKIKYQLLLMRPLVVIVLSDIRTKPANDVEVQKSGR